MYNIRKKYNRLSCRYIYVNMDDKKTTFINFLTYLYIETEKYYLGTSFKLY